MRAIDRTVRSRAMEALVKWRWVVIQAAVCIIFGLLLFARPRSDADFIAAELPVLVIAVGLLCLYMDEERYWASVAFCVLTGAAAGKVIITLLHAAMRLA